MILALHGFTGNRHDFDAISHATVSNQQWVSIDMPGHGSMVKLSSRTEYTQESFAKEIDVILPPKSILLGYSMGGRMALHYAIHYPQKLSALILISASPGIADDAERENRKIADLELARKIEDIGIPSFLDEWQNQTLIRSQENIPEKIRQAMRQERLKNDPYELALNLRGMGTGNMKPLWNELTNLSIPTLLVSGKNDSKYCGIAQQMKKLIPNSIHKFIPDAGHMPQLENIPAYLAVQNTFLDQNF